MPEATESESYACSKRIFNCCEIGLFFQKGEIEDITVKTPEPAHNRELGYFIGEREGIESN